MQICVSCREELSDQFRFCGFCGSPLDGAVLVKEARMTVTVLFCDLKGSTNLAEALDTESLRELITRYFEEMSEILEGHGGSVEKFIGDAIMAVFGLRKVHEDDALRAVRAAAEMRSGLTGFNAELARRWGVTLTNRIGVNTGEVVAGEPVRGQRLVIGDAVNVAARLEQAAPSNDILIGEPTYRLVQDMVEVEAVEPLELKGKSEPVPAYRLVSIKREEPAAHGRDRPLVGRREELAHLRAELAAATSERRPRMVTILGQPGVGKSALISELGAGAESEALVVRGRCLPYGRGITFWPLLEVVQQAAGISEEDSPEAAVAKLATLARDDRQVVERVASAVGLSEAQFAIEETFWAARKLLETVAAERPLVVVFEDIHWAELTFLDLIQHLARSGRGPMLLLCLARRELLDLRDDWGEQPDASLLSLEPLSDDDIGDLVHSLLGGDAVAERIQARVVDAAGGNPLFVEQMLSMMVDDGVLRQEEGRWVPSVDLTEVEVPPSINALVGARLDRLQREEREVIERASVIGLIFPQAAVEELVDPSVRSAVGIRLASLLARQLIHREATTVAGEGFRFDHILIRDAAYGRLLKRERAVLHERFVDWGERTSRGRHRESEFEEIVGYHLEQAARCLSELGPLDAHGQQVAARGATRLAGAGRRAFGRSDMPAAANMLRRAGELLPRRDPARLELLPDLVEALTEAGEFAAAEVFLDEAVEGAAANEDTVLDTRARLMRLLLQAHSSPPDQWSGQLVDEAGDIVALLEESGDHASLAGASRLLALAHAAAGRCGESAAVAAQAIEYASKAGDDRQRALAACHYAQVATYGPTPVGEAVQKCQEILEETNGDKRTEGIVTGLVGRLEAMQGNFERARSLYQRGRAVLEEMGQSVAACSTSLDSCSVEMLAGDPDAAERELRRDYAALEQMGEKVLLSTIAAELARTVYAKGEHDEAERLSQVAEQLAAEEDIVSQALWRTVRAKVLAERGVAGDAQRLAREAVEMLRPTGELVSQADALVDLADVCRLSETEAEERATLEEALELFERKGAVVSAAAVRDRIASLDSAAGSIVSGEPR